MSQVLGFVVQAAVKNYEEICSEHGIDLVARCSSGRLFGLRRYPWDQFVSFLDPMTDHLRRHGCSPLQFQLRLIPVLFRRLYAARFYRRALTPANILKMIETWAGPFMFRCGPSRFTDLGDRKVKIRIELYAELRSSFAFFEQCLAGMMAQLELMGFDKSVVQSLETSDRHLEVVFLLEDAVKPMPEDMRSVHENLLYWLDAFEAGTVAADQAPGIDGLAESLAHLCTLTQDLTTDRGAVLDSLTVINSRLQLARNLGWTSAKGLEDREIARQQGAFIRHILR